MDQFIEFVSKKDRDSKTQLGIVKKILEKHNLQVKDFREDSEPYIFVLNPGGGLSFDGIRIYKIGGTLAFRVQREDRTHPYGKSYNLDLQEMFSDYMSENMKHEEAGNKVARALVHEISDFFKKSSQAEKEIANGEFEDGALDQAAIRSTTGTDYSSKVLGAGFGSSNGR
jgi:hypothetical protein